MVKGAQADFEVAAALFYVLGAQVPHQKELESKARDMVQSLGRRKALEKTTELCRGRDDPAALYLLAKAGAWLGRGYREKTIQAAQAYLKGPKWQELPSRVTLEGGIARDPSVTVRADLLRDLAQAEQALGKLDKAQEHFAEAYRLEPYNAMNAVKIADCILRRSGRAEALRFLREQRKSSYFEPVKYQDISGAVHTNSAFKDLLNAQILKLQGEETGNGAAY